MEKGDLLKRQAKFFGVICGVAMIGATIYMAEGPSSVTSMPIEKKMLGIVVIGLLPIVWALGMTIFALPFVLLAQALKAFGKTSLGKKADEFFGMIAGLVGLSAVGILYVAFNLFIIAGIIGLLLIGVRALFG